MRALLPLLLPTLALGCASTPETPAPEPAPIDFDRDWDYGDPAATEERFLALLPAVEAAGDAERVLELRTQLARTKSLRREIDAAHAILDEVEAELTDATPVARVRWLLERGRTFNTAGEPEKAIPLFREAWDEARDLGAEFHAVDAAHMLGIAYGPDEGMAWTERALAYASECRDERARGWAGSLLQNLWYAHLERGELHTALSYAERCRAFREARGDVDGERVGRWLVLHTKRRLGRTAEALEGFRALHAEYLADIDGGGDGDPSGYTEEELGECLLTLGRPEEAAPYFARAYDVLSATWLAEAEPERIERLRRLGER